MTRCTYCGETVPDEAYEGHLERVHSDELTAIDRRRAKQVAGPPKKRNVALYAGVSVILVLFALGYLWILFGAGGPANTSATLPAELEDVDEDRQLTVPALGEGTVTVDVYEDLGCPFCYQFQEDVFPVLEEEYITTDAIEYRHYDFPVKATEESVAMANAARAVQDETRTEAEPNGRFFEYKNAVMESDDWSDEGLAATAEQFDVDPDVVMAALENDTYYPTLAADWEHGDGEGAVGTPTVVVDGEIVDNPLEDDAVADAIEAALES
ncbi:DsbA family protein [Natronorubrum thiooxidans]|uniref:Thioredoxin n=1 Tax=Natronorubrum thiooxidans TaxID=308853 RepID=A0A1N7GZT1_9EURY|nr:thioredoxin domain-containing protein [Natronorubrum thiooxidans]SIS18099.1 Thioredoxin [Natronorubrum thiooxidans]